MQLFYGLLADAVLILHFAFVAFVLFGGMLVLRYPRVMWLHLPALFWGLVVEWADWICPLTPLEVFFRLRGGQAGYQGDFLEHWIAAILYPPQLTLQLRYVIGLVLAALNAAVYGYVIWTKRKARKHCSP